MLNHKNKTAFKWKIVMILIKLKICIYIAFVIFDKIVLFLNFYIVKIFFICNICNIALDRFIIYEYLYMVNIISSYYFNINNSK